MADDGWMEAVGGTFRWHPERPQWQVVRRRLNVFQRRSLELMKVRSALVDTPFGSDDADVLLARLAYLEQWIAHVKKAREKRMQRGYKKPIRVPRGERVQVIQLKTVCKNVSEAAEKLK